MNNILKFDIITEPNNIPEYNKDNQSYIFDKLKGCKNKEIDGAFSCFRIETEQQFLDFVLNYGSDEKRIFRGQHCYDWYLTSTLERNYLLYLRDGGSLTYNKYVEKHFENFRSLARGKIKEQYLLSKYKWRISEEISEKNVNELWAIGQHLGLKTPLLDWSYSLSASLFFAFENERQKDKEGNFSYKDDYRVIFSIPFNFINNYFGNEGIIFEPDIDQYRRLTAQQGLFTDYGFIDNLFLYYKNQKLKEVEEYKFHKIYISDNLRNFILGYLNKFGINYLSIYPDLQAVVNYCNAQLNKTEQKEIPSG